MIISTPLLPALERYETQGLLSRNWHPAAVRVDRLSCTTVNVSWAHAADISTPRRAALNQQGFDESHHYHSMSFECRLHPCPVRAAGSILMFIVCRRRSTARAHPWPLARASRLAAR